MAGKDPDDNRPRRENGGSGKAGNGSGKADNGKATPKKSDPGTSGSGTPGSGTSGSGTPGSGTPGSGTPGSGTSEGEPDRSTTILPRARDDRSTTILPKTAERRRRDEFEDEADIRPGMSERTRRLLLIAGVAIVVILGLVLGYVALGGGGRPAAEPTAGVSIDPSTGESVTPTPAAALDDSSMINEQMAAQIDSKRTWQVASTQRGLDASSPRAACFAADPVDGQPDPQQVIQRLLSSTGKNAPALLHQAESYGTNEDAATAYVAISKALGSCAVVGAWIDSGRTITGLGDQSTGSVVAVTDNGTQSYHSIVISRTGRVVDIVDVAQPGSAANIGDTAKALGQAVAVQCTASGGACADNVKTKAGPPPLGGDEPGFLASGDLPPVGKTPSLWVGSTPAAPDSDYVGSNCETTDWSAVKATTKTMRTYTMQDNASVFGVDQIILTMDDEKSAKALVDKVKSDLDSCSKRKLTASVAKPTKVDGPAAENNEVAGYETTVSHKTASATVTFRVGIVSVGTKTIWTLANPTDNLDFTDDQWQTIVLRSGQRASQVQ